MIELLFAMAFSLHNAEEAVWLPEWSKNAKKFHQTVTKNEFIFAVISITIPGYLLTFLSLVLNSEIVEYAYLGYVGMMVLNSIFPHLIAAVYLRKYAPGLITGICLNAPIGIYIIVKAAEKYDFMFIVLSVLILSALTVVLLKYLFRIGKKILPE